MTLPPQIAKHVRIEGRVQGVGFRPFVYRLAVREGIHGWVRNAGGQVELHLQGPPSQIETVLAALTLEAPPSALISRLEIEPADLLPDPGFFRILSSELSLRGSTGVPPDQAMCGLCLEDMADPTNRRYRYPFTHCTQCGPRYTLIQAFPLDREQTVMSAFVLCPRCQAEYESPMDRRYHAQTQCCRDCGPSLRYVASIEDSRIPDDPIQAAVQLLGEGGILAVRGVGGYHLLCDAASTMAVTTLRQRKHRPDKPFAVMMGFQSIDGLPEPYRGALEALSRPVVLVPKTLAPAVVESVAPGLSECGLLLPDSPLHALLVEAFQGPLVTTSANLSGEPILTSLEDAEYSLSGIADGFLHHDRDILRPADDSVFRLIGESLRPLRIGRGSAPYEFQLQEPVEGCLLAVGGDLKNTIAMASGDRVIVSPHVGDLSSARSLDVFEGVIRDLSRLYGWSPDRMVCDAHPDYRTGHWARAQGLPVMAVYHHHAHAAALYEEFKTEGPLLIFAFDGLGYGEAGELWGGEVLWGEPGHWQRVGSLRPLPLPGGDRASREPWRLGVALAQASGLGSSFVHEGSEALLEFLERGIAVPMTSSMGRLFDAAAALAGVCTHQTHEGQAAMRLEALSHRGGAVLELPITQEGPLLRWNWEPLVSMLLNPQWTAAEKGSIFHATIAGAVVALIDHWGQSHPRTPVGLTGGVFQNKLLVEEIQRQLEGRATTLLIPKAVPLNDAGLSFGQLVEAGAVLRAKIGGLNLADRGRG